MLNYLKTCLILLFIKESSSTCVHEDVYSTFFDDFSQRDRNLSQIDCRNLESFSELDEVFSSQNEDDEETRYIVTVLVSNISSINPMVLSNYTKILRLDLNGLHIETIFPGAFDGLNTLIELNLDNNNLTEILNGVFNSLNFLTFLNLDNNKI